MYMCVYHDFWQAEQAHLMGTILQNVCMHVKSELITVYTVYSYPELIPVLQKPNRALNATWNMS